MARFVAARLLRASRLCSLFRIRRNGYELRFYPTAISAVAWSNPRYGEQDEEVCRRILRPGDNVIDVGANVGTFALAAWAATKERGRVFAIEPHPLIAKYLQRNVALNRASQIRVIQAAAGELSGEVRLSPHRSDDLNFVSHSGIPVRMVTIDSIAPDAPVRLLKIDAEGYELMVLRGAARTLERADFVYFESYRRLAQRFGYDPGDVIDLLKTRGFVFAGPIRDQANLLACRRGMNQMS